MEANPATTLEKRSELEATWLKYTQEGHKAHEDRRYAFGELKFLSALKAAESLAEGLRSADFAHVDAESNAEKLQGFADLERLARALNNVAALYQLQGKYEMAEAAYERSLDIKLDLYGADHLETAVNLHNLATLHCAKRRYEKAEILYKRVLEVRENLLGEDDVQLVAVLKNYAAMLKKVHRDEEALALEERACAIEKKA